MSSEESKPAEEQNQREEQQQQQEDNKQEEQQQQPTATEAASAASGGGEEGGEQKNENAAQEGENKERSLPKPKEEDEKMNQKQESGGVKNEKTKEKKKQGDEKESAAAKKKEEEEKKKEEEEEPIMSPEEKRALRLKLEAEEILQQQIRIQRMSMLVNSMTQQNTTERHRQEQLRNVRLGGDDVDRTHSIHGEKSDYEANPWFKPVKQDPVEVRMVEAASSPGSTGRRQKRIIMSPNADENNNDNNNNNNNNNSVQNNNSNNNNNNNNDNVGANSMVASFNLAPLGGSSTIIAGTGRGEEANSSGGLLLPSQSSAFFLPPVQDDDHQQHQQQRQGGAFDNSPTRNIQRQYYSDPTPNSANNISSINPNTTKITGGSEPRQIQHYDDHQQPHQHHQMNNNNEEEYFYQDGGEGESEGHKTDYLNIGEDPMDPLVCSPARDAIEQLRKDAMSDGGIMLPHNKMRLRSLARRSSPVLSRIPPFRQQEAAQEALRVREHDQKQKELMREIQKSAIVDVATTALKRKEREAAVAIKEGLDARTGQKHKATTEELAERAYRRKHNIPFNEVVLTDTKKVVEERGLEARPVAELRALADAGASIPSVLCQAEDLAAEETGVASVTSPYSSRRHKSPAASALAAASASDRRPFRVTTPKRAVGNSAFGQPPPAKLTAAGHQQKVQSAVVQSATSSIKQRTAVNNLTKAQLQQEQQRRLERQRELEEQQQQQRTPRSGASPPSSAAAGSTGGGSPQQQQQQQQQYSSQQRNQSRSVDQFSNLDDTPPAASQALFGLDIVAERLAASAKMIRVCTHVLRGFVGPSLAAGAAGMNANNNNNSASAAGGGGGSGSSPNNTTTVMNFDPRHLAEQAVLQCIETAATSIESVVRDPSFSVEQLHTVETRLAEALRDHNTLTGGSGGSSTATTESESSSRQPSQLQTPQFAGTPL